MSASLVGSEMCIRDRPTTRLARTASTRSSARRSATSCKGTARSRSSCTSSTTREGDTCALCRSATP
eukprot:13606030-Alexandrium_andersonii.AAC.1